MSHVCRDMRGRHIPKNKLSEAIRDSIRSHIRLVPVYDSHYSRNRTRRSYMGSDLNIEKMYSLYKLKCEEKGMEKGEITKAWIYRHIFRTKFNKVLKSHEMILAISVIVFKCP